MTVSNISTTTLACSANTLSLTIYNHQGNTHASPIQTSQPNLTENLCVSKETASTNLIISQDDLLSSRDTEQGTASAPIQGTDGSTTELIHTDEASDEVLICPKCHLPVSGITIQCSICLDILHQKCNGLKKKQQEKYDNEGGYICSLCSVLTATDIRENSLQSKKTQKTPKSDTTKKVVPKNKTVVDLTDTTKDTIEDQVTAKQLKQQEKQLKQREVELRLETEKFSA